MSNRHFLQLLATTRPSFLILTPCCLSLAFAYAVQENITINYLHAMMILIGALSAHISVNMLNEYEDFTSGLDLHTQRTSFSGGSGTLPTLPELAKSVQKGALISLLITMAIGVYFLYLRGLGLLPLGLLGITSIFFYTNTITHRPLLCLLVPGFAFGLLMINGAYFALTGYYSLSVFCSSLTVFFLVNNLLLLNQFPDREADKKVGRLHLPILIGRKRSAWVYSAFLAAAFILVVFDIALKVLPVYSVLGLIPLLLAIPAANIALQYFDDMEKLQTAMALNVALTLATPVLMALGLFINRQFG